MREQQQLPKANSQLFWTLKSHVEKIPGAFRLYKFVTSRTGEGKIYTVASGPMQGLRWKRYNRLPYWYHAGLYEPQLTNYIQKHLPPGGVFWDIGAHAGYHAICAARVVGEQGRVIAVEADPDIAAIMREQIALNALQNVTVLPQAVADKVGTITFMRSGLDSRTSSIAGLGGERGQGTAIDVPTITLDVLLEQYPPPDMLKMDIEGARDLRTPRRRASLQRRVPTGTCPDRCAWGERPTIHRTVSRVARLSDPLGSRL
ncbi:MAG: FkbM family methyltransferase [Chloroflexi bacterium]|nr:FkbM family methyltransferase [Chloroflexota bacterium]